jgi:replicative superfamily II helicase
MVNKYVEVAEWCNCNDVSKSDVSDVKDVRGCQDTAQEEAKRVFYYSYQSTYLI